jgi:diguanylate cyclase (GGDEF)-like protein/PAS domain S-box-containing protein
VEGLRVFGLGPSDALQFRALLRMIPEDERDNFIELIHDAMAHSTVLATDIRASLLDGRQRIVHIEAEPEFNEHGNLIGYTGIVQDVTDRRMAEDRIRHLANFDTLTGLPNRRQLIWRAERALEQARRLGHEVALLLIDLDRFKQINDSLGHDAGDALLIEAAIRLQAAVRKSDCVARLGGDEFGVLVAHNPAASDIENICQRIMEGFLLPVPVNGAPVNSSASIGVAVFADHGATLDSLYKSADLALYEAKRAGGNTWRWYRGQSAQSSIPLSPGLRAL